MKLNLNVDTIRACEPRVSFTDPADAGVPITFTQEWEGPRLRTLMRNEGDRPVRVREVVLADLPHDLPGNAGIYGEGFTHLSLTGGTIAEPEDVASYTDRDHYRLPVREGATTVYWMLLLSPPGQDHILMGFATAFRFVSKFHLRRDTVRIVLECEDIAIDPGEVWYLEDFVFLIGPDRAAVLDEFADHMREGFRPELILDKPPTGWCSWYCFGSGVTAENVRSNLDFMSKHVPELKYIQIDDGYQAAIGDWLETGSAFGGGVQKIVKEIRDSGFEPAIWVAPFVAQEDSKLFREHPEWFVKDAEGKPLRSDRVTFGGWRFGPWYALDGTHPQAQTHLIKLFNTMRFDWGIKYFKLDACFWGAMHGGRRFDPKATRIRAYRLGMRAIQRGADWTFLLAGNHPTWPSMGIFQAWRTSDDIHRSWASFSRTGRQNLMRNWMNRKVLWNDPDCVVLTGDLPENEFRFHASVIYASGGSVLSGDDLPTIQPHRLEMLRKLLPPTGRAAKFEDDALEVGLIQFEGREMVCLFNWGDEPKKLAFRLDRASRVTDFWSGKDLGVKEGTVEMRVDGRSAVILECVGA